MPINLKNSVFYVSHRAKEQHPNKEHGLISLTNKHYFSWLNGFCENVESIRFNSKPRFWTWLILLINKWILALHQCAWEEGHPITSRKEWSQPSVWHQHQSLVFMTLRIIHLRNTTAIYLPWTDNHGTVVVIIHRETRGAECFSPCVVRPSFCLSLQPAGCHVPDAPSAVCHGQRWTTL